MRGVPGIQKLRGFADLGDGVQSRAISLHAIDANSQVQGVMFQLPETSSETVLIGLHSGGGDTQDLDFALKSDQNGMLWIHEKGVLIAPLGPFTKSDTLSIIRTSDSVLEYRVGCSMRGIHRGNIPVP